MTPLLVFTAICVVLAIIGPLFGADSRDGKDWKPIHWPSNFLRR